MKTIDRKASIRMLTGCLEMHLKPALERAKDNEAPKEIVAQIVADIKAAEALISELKTATA